MKNILIALIIVVLFFCFFIFLVVDVENIYSYEELFIKIEDNPYPWIIIFALFYVAILPYFKNKNKANPVQTMTIQAKLKKEKYDYGKIIRLKAKKIKEHEKMEEKKKIEAEEEGFRKSLEILKKTRDETLFGTAVYFIEEDIMGNKRS